MKVITLSQDTIIDDCLYRKGQVVQVDDNFNENIAKIIVESQEFKQREKVKVEKIKSKKGK